MRRLLRDDEDLLGVAAVWRRHRWFVPYTLLATLVVGLVAALSGFTAFGSVGLGAAGGAIAATATTRQFVVAVTDRSLVLMRGGRVRQVAVEAMSRHPKRGTVESMGGNLLVSEWSIDERVYSSYARSDQVLHALAAGRI